MIKSIKDLFSVEFKDKVKHRIKRMEEYTLPEYLVTAISKIYLRKGNFDGILMYYRFGSNDKSVIHDVISNKEYLNYNIPLNESSIIIDIGCHIGSFAIQAAKIAKKGKIFAFEPFEENYSLAERNIKLNNLFNVKLQNVGILSETKNLQFYISNDNTGCHGIYERENGTAKVIEIQCISFDSFLDSEKIKEVDLLKLDCEGSEYDIIENSNLDKIKRVILEYHEFPGSGKTIEGLIKTLSDRNFNLIKEVRYADKPIGVGVAYFEKLSRE